MPFVQLVDTQGVHDRGHQVAGRVRQGRRSQLVLDDLKERGLLFARRALRSRLSLLLALRYAPAVLRPPHVVHQDDRRAGSSWWRNNRTINWLPDNIKEGRMGNFLENVH